MGMITTTDSAKKALGRAEMISLAKEIRAEFAKLRACMDRILVDAPLKKAA